MKTRFFSLVALVLLAASCTNILDDVDSVRMQAGTGDDVEFYATIEGDDDFGGSSPETKVYADEKMRVLWNADDRITIYNKETYGRQFAFTGSDGDNAGGFKEVKTDNGSPLSYPLDNIYAVYPYAPGNTIDKKGVLSLTLPAEQTYKEHSFGIGANTMLSVSKGTHLKFRNVGGYLSLRLYGEGASVKSITLKGNNNEKLAGDAKITMPVDGTPTTVMQSTATETVTLTCETPVALGATADDYTDFWFVLPPTTFEKGFTVVVTDAENRQMEIVTNKTKTIPRNSLIKMAVAKATFSQPDITLDCNTFFRYADASEVAVYITPANGTSYSVSIPSEAASWVRVSSCPGSGEGFTTLSLTANLSGYDRTATVSMNYGNGLSKDMTIIQKAYVKEDYFSEWGLEGTLVSSVSNDRPYAWYVDQRYTGDCSSVNCGPSSTAMASRWYNGNFRQTAEDARNEYYREGGWWYTSDISSYFSKHGINYSITSYTNNDGCVSELKKGNILLLCLDMYYITYGNVSGYRVNKFYRTNSTGWGHFIIVKGYVQTSTKLYFEVYDPNSWGSTYSTGEPKGLDRYYAAEDILKSAEIWWKYKFSIGDGTHEAVRSNEAVLNPQEIPDACGRGILQ